MWTRHCGSEEPAGPEPEVLSAPPCQSRLLPQPPLILLLSPQFCLFQNVTELASHGMHLFWTPFFSKNNSFIELEFTYHTMPPLQVCNLMFSVSSRSCNHRRRRRYDIFFTSILFSILLSLTASHPLCPWMSQFWTCLTRGLTRRGAFCVWFPP